jgi:hypothetical protein
MGDFFTAKMQVDTRQFEAALNEYAQFDKRTLPEIVTAKLGDWCFEAAKRCPSAIAANIKMLEYNIKGGPQAFWKLVQSIYNAGFNIKGRRKASESEAARGYIDSATGRRVGRRQTVSFYRTTGTDAHKKNDLRRVAKSMLKRRAARAKAMISQFLFTALKLGKRVTQVGGKNSQRFTDIYVQEASRYGLKPSAVFSIPFRAMTIENKEHEGDRGKRENEKVNFAIGAVNRARAEVIRDMRQKTAERYARKAAQVSGRAA